MLIWTSEFETGVTEVDIDHKRLIAGLNELELALSQGGGSRKVPEILRFLHSYAAEHFAREEGCMNRFRCPVAAANKAAHQHFIAKITAAQKRIEESKGSAALVAVQVHRELCDWIVQHVLKVDAALRHCIRPSVAQAS